MTDTITPRRHRLPAAVLPSALAHHPAAPAGIGGSYCHHPRAKWPAGRRPPHLRSVARSDGTGHPVRGCLVPLLPGRGQHHHSTEESKASDASRPDTKAGIEGHQGKTG